MLGPMLDTIFGLPVHPLVVHATVVLTPVATLLVAVCAVVPASRRRLVWPTVVACALACLTVAAAALSGGNLERRVGGSPAIHRHSELADVLVFWVVAMSVAALLLAYVSWYRAGAPVAAWLRVPDRLARRAAPAQLARLVAVRWLLPAASVLSLVTAVGTMVAVVLVGHSGAQAAWAGVGSGH
jgi:uncharacterized membrane protein